VLFATIDGCCFNGTERAPGLYQSKETRGDRVAAPQGGRSLYFVRASDKESFGEALFMHRHKIAYAPNDLKYTSPHFASGSEISTPGMVVPATYGVSLQ